LPLICLLFVLGAPGLRAQSTGTVTGRVLDDTGAPLPAVIVELRRSAAEAVATTTTDSDGRYALESLPAGPARLMFRLLDFDPVDRDLVVAAGQSTTVDVTMELALGVEDIVVAVPRAFRDLADVEDPDETLVGVAVAASQGAVTATHLETRPIMRAAEVLETVPGFVISQHSGEGKANQYYLRGFNLDHGTDFFTNVDGVPINMPTHAHGHGYADANFLIPELVRNVQFRKGPYYAQDGDFSAAGAADISYVSRLEQPIALVAGGQDGWGRVLAAASPTVAGGPLVAAIELNHNDGPWVRPDDYRKANGLLRFSRSEGNTSFAITGMGFWSEWDATDQVPQRAVESGLIPLFGHIDPTDGGRTYRHSVSFGLERSTERRLTSASAFLMGYGVNLFSNFTYFLDNPIDGDQFEQADRRVVVGGHFADRRLGRLGSRNVESRLGVQIRHDDIDTVGLYSTVARRRVATTREDAVTQTSIGLFAEAEIEWTPVVRTTAGLRGDLYRFDVTAGNPRNSGERLEGLLSPKAAAVFGPWARTEIYVNAGLGFHSNDARGATITEHPVTGEPVDQVTPLVRAGGAEVGLRTERLRGVQSTLTVWVLRFDSELVFVGDAGATEAGRPSRRAGVEWTNYVRLQPWLILDADLSFSRARFTDDDPAGQSIPGALDRVISAGMTVEPDHPVFGSVRLRHFGPRPLVEDNSVRSDSTTLVNAEIGYQVSDRFRLIGELFNLFDARVSDIDYYYTSRLPGEPLAGVDGVHTHPAPPRTARLGLRVSF
jgi:hypothetical protein